MSGLRLGSRLWWGLVPLGVLLWGVGAIASSVIPGLPTAPLLTLAGAPVLAYADTVALAIALGALIVSLWTPSALALRWALSWAAIGLGLVVLGAAALYSEVTARPLGTEPAGLVPLLMQAPAGRAALFQVGSLGLAVLIVAAAALRSASRRVQSWATWCAIVLVASAVGAPAIGGHAGLSSEHQVAGFATALHAIAISAWVGGLAVVSAYCLREQAQAPAVLRRFSVLALVCVVIAAEAGILGASLILGRIEDLVGSTYGSLIAAKAVILACLIRLGWLQRRRALDRLPDASVPSIVARLAVTELTLMGLAIAGSVVLIRVGPPSIPAAGIAPLTLVMLAIGLPILIAQFRGSGWRVSNAWPEATMIVLLLAMIEVGGVGLVRWAFGTVGMLLEFVVLVFVGWLAICAAGRSLANGSVAALLIGILGVPAVMVANWLVAEDLAAEGLGWRMSLVSGLVGVGMLAVSWMMGARERSSEPSPDQVSVSP